MKNKTLYKYNPDYKELEFNWGKSWQDEDGSYKEFRFTSANLSGGKVLTYGVIGIPANIETPAPAILHIHGGGQTCSLEDIKYNLKRNYICMSFDWTGPTPERAQSVTTQFPFTENNNCDMMEQLSNGDIDNCRLLLAAKAAKACLIALSEQPEVDSDKIGIYGISWGGYITWLLNGSCHIQKCATPIYGTGGLFSPGHIFNSVWNKMAPEKRTQWLYELEPLYFAGHQQSPVYFINGTNDFFGGFDTSTQLLAKVQYNCICDYTANSNHAFNKSSSQTFDKWTDYYLKGIGEEPVAPVIKAEIVDSAAVEFSVEDSTATTLFWSCGNADHAFRCWHSSDNWDENNCIKLNLHGNIWYYTQKTFADGSTISSQPAMLSQAYSRDPEKQEVLFTGNDSTGWGSRMATQLFSKSALEHDLEFTDEGLIIREPVANLVYHGCIEESRRANPDSKLKLNLSGIKSATITIVPNGPETQWTARLTEADSTILSVDDFSCEKKDATLPGFDFCGYFILEIEPDENKVAILHNMEWI